MPQRAEPRITIHALPAKPRDWVTDGRRVGRLRDIRWVDGEILMDIVLYGFDGDRIGRESPACGGPRGHEPMVPWDGWHRIDAPAFPIALKWVPNGDGTESARPNCGTALPDRSWIKVPKRVPRKIAVPAMPEDMLVEALRAIAAGHNDARQLARETLRRAGLLNKEN